jgi:hypothetical protein
MQITSITLLFFAGLVLASCGNQKPIADGFACVTPMSHEQLERGKLEISYYQETSSGSGQYIPKGWVAVPDGPYNGCFVPFNNHDTRTTVMPKPHQP